MPTRPCPKSGSPIRTNPSISFWDTRSLSETIARIPFMVAFAYTVDETNYMADVLLPEATDLESTQLIRIGGTKYIEQFWDHQGVVLRQPVVEPQGEARDFTWISTELARRVGLLEPYNAAINRGAGSVPLKGEGLRLQPRPGQVPPEVDAIWDAVPAGRHRRAVRRPRQHDLEWFKEHGFYTVPMSRRDWYLTPNHGAARPALRAALPGAAAARRRELGRRLHEQGIHWWDEQLTEYRPAGLARRARRCGRRRGEPGRRKARGLPLLAAHHQEHAVHARATTWASS
jgi:phenylacetyl-CoA:acceptor oxidoreductase